MDDVIRERLVEAMARKGVSASAMAKEIGVDKAYFVDFIAGRKKTITAQAFMLAVTSLGGDPWELAGLDSADRPKPSGKRDRPRPEIEIELSPQPPERAAPEKGPFPDLFTLALPEAEPQFARLSGLVEETAFRRLPATGSPADEISYPLMRFHPAERQCLLEVRGGDYRAWGVADGAIVYALKFARYEGVASPGRLLVRRRSIGQGLFETVLRRVAVDGDGLIHLVSPSGASAAFKGDEADAETLGMVVQEVTPLPG